MSSVGAGFIPARYSSKRSLCDERSQPADGLLELLHQEMLSEASLDRFDDAGEVPELTLRARVERPPDGVGVLRRVKVGQQ